MLGATLSRGGLTLIVVDKLEPTEIVSCVLANAHVQPTGHEVADKVNSEVPHPAVSVFVTVTV